jgi:hypothetical protein
VESLSSGETSINLKSNGDINPLLLHVKIKSTGFKRRKSKNISKESEDRYKKLEMFKDISEDLIGDLGNSFMKMFSNSCNILNYRYKLKIIKLI